MLLKILEHSYNRPYSIEYANLASLEAYLYGYSCAFTTYWGRYLLNVNIHVLEDYCFCLELKTMIMEEHGITDTQINKWSSIIALYAKGEWDALRKGVSLLIRLRKKFVLDTNIKIENVVAIHSNKANSFYELLMLIKKDNEAMNIDNMDSFHCFVAGFTCFCHDNDITPHQDFSLSLFMYTDLREFIQKRIPIKHKRPYYKMLDYWGPNSKQTLEYFFLLLEEFLKEREIIF